MCGASEQHQVGDDVVVIGRDAAPFKVPERDGVRSSCEHLSVTGAYDQLFTELRQPNLTTSFGLFPGLLSMWIAPGTLHYQPQNANDAQNQGERCGCEEGRDNLIRRELMLATV